MLAQQLGRGGRGQLGQGGRTGGRGFVGGFCRVGVGIACSVGLRVGSGFGVDVGQLGGGRGLRIGFGRARGLGCCVGSVHWHGVRQVSRIGHEGAAVRLAWAIAHCRPSRPAWGSLAGADQAVLRRATQ